MFSLLVDRAKDVVADSLRSFFTTNSASITMYSSEYRKMIEDNILGVVRQYVNLSKTLPFVVISAVSGSESVVGFGRNRLRVEGQVLIESAVGPFNLSGSAEGRWYIQIKVDDKTYMFDVYGVLFTNDAIVSAQEIADVIIHQLPRGFWLGTAGGKLQIFIDTKEVEVLATSGELGFTIGKKTPVDYRLVTGVSQNLSLSIDVGAESEIVRAQVVDLIMLWIDWLRLHYLSFGDIGETIDLSLAGQARMGTEVEQSFGGGDVFLYLYINRIDIPLILYAYENETVLSPVTAVSSIYDQQGVLP